MTPWFAFCLLMFCFQVILLAESQGGQVASKLAPLVLPDLLVLLASLPDEPDITPLRNEHVQTVIGWKVGNHFRFNQIQYLYVCRRKSTCGEDEKSRSRWCGISARQPLWLEGTKDSPVATARSSLLRSRIVFCIS